MMRSPLPGSSAWTPEDTCCDRFTYVLTLTEGDRTNTVTTIDAAEAPESLFTLIDVFRSAVTEGAQPAIGSPVTRRTHGR